MSPMQSRNLLWSPLEDAGLRSITMDTIVAIVTKVGEFEQKLIPPMHIRKMVTLSSGTLPAPFAKPSRSLSNFLTQALPLSTF